MDLLVDGFRQAFGLLASGNAEIRAVLWLSLLVSSTATLVALLIGVPAGVALALGRFPGRRLLISAVNAGMGLPPVVGGNIKGHTRTLTTSMVLETSKGNFDAAIALAVLLLVLIFLVNWGLTVVQQRRAP